MPTGQGFGAQIQRVEDPRFLRGEMTCVDGLRVPDIQRVAFVQRESR